MNGKQLRNSILQWAISGRLVPQDPADEPAIALLRRINPKAAPLAPDDAPFPIPDSWCWCRVGDIVQINPKNNCPDDTMAAFIPMEKIEATYGSKYTYDEVKWSSIKKGYTHFADGDVAFAKITPCFQNRKSAVFKDLPNGIGAGTTELKVLRPYGEALNRWYLLYFLKSSYFIAVAKFKGTANQQRVVKGYLENKMFPLPPLAEQERIVKEVERWFACIEQLERSREALGKAARQTKRTLLSLAISGRLVPQDPSDEPAIALLRRINPKFTPQPTDSPLPPGWTACRLEDIVDYEQPQAYIVESTDYNDNYETPVLTAGKSFIKGYTKETSGIYNNLPCIIFDDFTTDSRYIDFPFKVKSSAMKILRVHAFSTKYVALFMSITRLIGDTHKRYWISEYSKLSFPLPPLAEQERIVGKVEELFAVLDALQ